MNIGSNIMLIVDIDFPMISFIAGTTGTVDRFLDKRKIRMRIPVRKYQRPLFNNIIAYNIEVNQYEVIRI